jgi:hypothetical protein
MLGRLRGLEAFTPKFLKVLAFLWRLRWALACSFIPELLVLKARF